MSHQLVGVPEFWPAKIHKNDADVVSLRELAESVDKASTRGFNEVIKKVDPSLDPVSRALAVSSERARIFNYPKGTSPYPPMLERDLYIGHCTRSRTEAALTSEWRARLARLAGWPRVLIALGTFQYVHTDILQALERGVRSAHPDASIFVAAGERAHMLRPYADERTLVCDFLPQPELLPHMDVVVHHGGNNSFTESIVASVPSLILPFAGDQFAVANDADSWGVGICLDPNHFTAAEVVQAMRRLLDEDLGLNVKALSMQVARRGPRWAAERLLARMAGLPCDA